MTDEKINLKEYEYKPGDTVEIDGKMLETFLVIFDELQRSETHYGFSDTFSKNTEVTYKDFEGEQIPESVKQKFEQHSAQSYFTQDLQIFKTKLGVMSLQILQDLKQLHLNNIKNGKAVRKQGTFFTNGSGEA